MRSSSRSAAAMVAGMALCGAVKAETLPTSLPKLCNASTPDAIAAAVNHTLSCGFDRAAMSYAGPPVQQARCLLRVIPNSGALSSADRPLPPSLEAKVGTPIDVTANALRRYLSAKGVSAEDIGGNVDTPLSQTPDGRPASYFVIHDTSAPYFPTKSFPAIIDTPSWTFNALSRWKKGDQSVAHVFIARTGASTTALDYSTPWRATKTESCVLLDRSRGLFIHTEMVQPRISDPKRGSGNDAWAPDGRFKPYGDAQLDRLALIYVAASVRAGHWLIPASHAAIDDGLYDGHDDPRAFPIADWSARVDKVLAEIRGG